MATERSDEAGDRRLMPGCPAARVRHHKGALRVALHADGIRFGSALLDTGSTQTWLPAVGPSPRLRLAGAGRGVCVPSGGRNWSVVYADGSGVSGIRCRTRLVLAGVAWEQEIVAATSLRESAELKAAGRSVAGGLLALAPAVSSSFESLARAAGGRLTLCAPRKGLRGRLLLGRPRPGCGCDRGDAVASQPLPLPLYTSTGDPPTHWKLSGAAPMLVLSTATVRWPRPPGPARTAVAQLPRNGGLAEVHLDSGASHVLCERELRSEIARATAGGRTVVALAVTLGAPDGARVRPPAWHPPRVHARASSPPLPLLLPLTVACTAAGGNASHRSDIDDLSACSLVPLIPSRRTQRLPQRWVLGAPLFARFDVSLRLGGGDAASEPPSPTTVTLSEMASEPRA